jgi:hypothetical protein
VQKATDEEFIAAWDRCLGSPGEVAKALGITERNIHARRKSLAAKGVLLHTVDAYGRNTSHSGPLVQFERRRLFDVANGSVVVFSDRSPTTRWKS